MIPATQRPNLRRIGESAITKVLGSFLSLSATVRESEDDSPISAASDEINSSVLLTGHRLSGSVHLRLPQAFVANAARRLAGLDGGAENANELEDDAAGELANMVAGRVASQLAADGYPCTLGTPSVSRSALPPIPTQPGSDHGRVELICDGHCLTLELHCRHAPR